MTLNSDICVDNYIDNENAIHTLENKWWSFISVFVPDLCILF